MLCAFPRTSTFGLQLPCGQCMPCRINRRRQWAARILLENTCHEYSWFVTLTYSPESVPLAWRGDEPVQVLDPYALQLFMKRVRNDAGEGVRFFAVGEYGDRTQRPHYHVILFGLGPEWFKINPETGHLQFVKETWWPLGLVGVGEFNIERAQYIAHYTTKKWTHKDDERLQGRPPEFMRCSRRPGIGALAVPYLAAFYETEEGSKILAENGDIDRVFRHYGKWWPMDRFLRTKLREAHGIPQKASERPPLPAALQAALLTCPSAEELNQRQKAHDRLRRKAFWHGKI